MDGGTNVMASEKASMIEAEERREVIFEMLIKGYRRSQIMRFCAEKYNIRERQVDVYIAQVKEQLNERIEKKKDEHLNLALIRYNDLYSKNYSIQDYRECRAVQDSINKLLGINEPDKVDHKILEPRIFNI